MAMALMVITYVPNISLWLPLQTGQLKAEEVRISVENWNINVYGKQSESAESSQSE